ncbi:uracil-xanthine permease family protein [Roseococcus microcysteis]|uniref:uracil-xanthine permease family protein n=1 Tax=Roseococcus microcysteis TaxID=2771361 RepID=UPI00168A6026|nr:solute carrier family 23 protein [Roseococcus microcysteis]
MPPAGAPRAWRLHETPPAPLLVASALQQAGLAAVTLGFPLLVAEAAGADAALKAAVLQWSMLAMGIATLLQCWGRWGIGSGYLICGIFTAIYLPLSVVVAQREGLAAVAGMTIVAGLTQMALSPFVRRLRNQVPNEIIGLIVLLVGLALGILAVRLMVVGSPAEPALGADRGVAVTTFCLIVALAIWGPPRIRPLAVLAGMVGGTALALLLGSAPETPAVEGVSLLDGPPVTPSFNWALLPGFLLGALASLVRCMGDIIAAQRAEDPHWTRPDQRSIRGGVLADGMGTTLAGLMGLPGMNSYTGSVGLAVASGVRSRVVGLAAGAFWVGLALLPSAAVWMLLIPQGVLGAALLYVSAFIIASGFITITQRLLDQRRTVLLGVSLVVGLSGALIPGLYEGLPFAVQALTFSSLALALAVALVLGPLLRIGLAREVGLEWRPAEGVPALLEAARVPLQQWGVRRAVADRVGGALEEFALLAEEDIASGGAVHLRMENTDPVLRLTLSWQGVPITPLDPATPPEEPDLRRVALLLLRHKTDAMRLRAVADGRPQESPHFR